MKPYFFFWKKSKMFKFQNIKKLLKIKTFSDTAEQTIDY